MNTRINLLTYYTSYRVAVIEILLTLAISFFDIFYTDDLEERFMMILLFTTFVFYQIIFIVYEKRKDHITKVTSEFIDNLEMIMRYIAKASIPLTIISILCYRIENAPKLHLYILCVLMTLLLVLISVRFFIYNSKKKKL